VKNAIYCVGLGACLALAELAGAARPPQQAAEPVRPIGVVTRIEPGKLVLRTDAGPELTVALPEGVSVLRVPPGAKNLQEASAISVGDIAAGDRVLIVGAVAAGQKSMVAKRVIDMSKAALTEAHEAQRQEWQQRGIGGVVASLNPADKSLVMAVQNTPPTPANPTHPVTVRLAPDAKLLRYAPDSARFSDAKPGTFGEIKVGDQVRALAAGNAHEAHITAEVLVSGTFRNIAATVISADPAQGTMTVKDLATGKPVLVRTTADSKLHQLPPAIAEMIAQFNSNGGGKSPEGQGGPPRRASTGAEAGAEGFRPAGGEGNRPAGAEGGRPGMERGNESAAGGMPGGGPPGDFNQMLEHTPPLSLNELKPGEPLIVVSTEGAKPGEVTAIAVLSGVEPILRARPKGSQEVRLGPWSMGGGGGVSETGGAGPGP
jgi:hypothetical protein